MEPLDLGKLDKGAVTLEGKYKSLRERWFKAKVPVGCDDNNSTPSTTIHSTRRIQRNSLVTVNCKNKGGGVTQRQYRVLAFFGKYYNKWFMNGYDNPDNHPWSSTNSTGGVRVLLHLVSKVGVSSYQEKTVEKDGEFGPSDIYCIRPINDIHSVECDLEDMN